MYITLYNIVTRLPDSLRVVKDHFLSVCPTTLTVDLLEKALLAAEKSIVAVGASRGDPRTPIFEGCSPSPLLPSVASAAAADLVGLESVRLAGVVEVAVEAAGDWGWRWGVVAGGEVVVAAAEAEAAVAVAVGAEAALAAEVEAAVVEEVELVGVVLLSGAAPGVVSASSSSTSSVLRDIPLLSSSVSGTRSVSVVGFWPVHLRSFAPATARVSSVGVLTPPSAALAASRTLGISSSRKASIGTAALGTGEAAALGASAPAPSGAGESALSVAVSLADPSGGPVLSHFSTVLPCPAAPSLHLVWSLPPLVLYELGMASRVLFSGLPQSLPPLPPGPGPSCVPCVEGRLRAAPHSSQSTPTEAPLQTLHMDVWGPARVRGQGHERYFLLVVDDYSRLHHSLPLAHKSDVAEVLIDWIRAARLQLRRSFGSDFPVLRLHSDRGGEFSSGLLRAYCRARGIRQTFTLPDSPQQNGIAERRIGMVMDVARTSMMHAAAPHFLWAFAVRYAAHQINLHPRVSRPEDLPSLAVDGEGRRCVCVSVSWGSRRLSATCLRTSCPPRAAPCVFLGFPPDAPGWQFYHPTSRRVLSSQDVTFDKSVPYYHLFPYRTPSLPPPPHFLVPVEPVEVAGDSGTAAGAEPGGAYSGGAATRGAEPGGAEPGGATTRGAELGGATTGGAEPGGPSPRGAASGAELREWVARRWRRTTGAGASSAAEVAGAAGLGGTSPVSATESELLRVLALRPTAVSLGGGPAAGAAVAVEVLELEVLLTLVLPLGVLVLSLLCLKSPRGLGHTLFRSFSRFLVFLLP
ncbi:unnamed protein product [Closterium sp. NIES-64]|nr:unnamed protein product [Closterium sp. NIES-64]